MSRGKEAALSRALETVEAQLSPTSPAGLQRRLDALAAACRLRASSGTLGMGPAGQNGAKLDEASLQQLFAVLKEHMEGVKQLQEVLRRCGQCGSVTSVATCCSSFTSGRHMPCYPQQRELTQLQRMLRVKRR
jgi:hypothetical protein